MAILFSVRVVLFVCRDQVHSTLACSAVASAFFLLLVAPGSLLVLSAVFFLAVDFGVVSVGAESSFDGALFGGVAAVDAVDAAFPLLLLLFALVFVLLVPQIRDSANAPHPAAAKIVTKTRDGKALKPVTKQTDV